MLLDRRARRLHVDLTLEERTFADADAGREHIALDLGGRTNVDGLGGIEIAFHFAVDDDDGGANVALHRTFGSHREALRARVRTFHPALKAQVLFPRHIAAEARTWTH